MGRQIIQTNRAPQAIGPYSQAVRAGDTVYLSGQIPLDPETMQLVTGDIEAEIRRVFENLKAVADAIQADATNDQQGHRYRDLQRSSEAMNATNAEPACAGIVFQGRDDHGTTETNRRQKSEDQACQKAEPDTDRDHAKIELQGVLERKPELGASS